jgi:hypothetical protein
MARYPSRSACRSCALGSSIGPRERADLRVAREDRQRVGARSVLAGRPVISYGVAAKSVGPENFRMPTDLSWDLAGPLSVGHSFPFYLRASGRMFWFDRNRFAGSYRALTRARRG